MTDVVLLRSIIEEKKCSISYLARATGRTTQGILNKLKGKNEFVASEIKVLSDVLQLTPKQRDEIFFADDVE